MDELTQSLDAFGPWDWACVIANLLVAIIGLFALKCWRNLPGKFAGPTTSVGDAVIGLSTGLLSFGILFGVVTGLVSQAFSTHFGISQAHLFTAAFCGQLAAAATMLAMGALAPKTLGWAPSIETDEPKPAGSAFRHALRAFSFPRILLGLLAIFALGLAATLLWKGFHVAWEQLFLRGWAGQPPADEPQEIVDAVLKTDVDTWRFLTITLAVTIGAPIMEELAFRGMIYPGISRILSESSQWIRGILWLTIIFPVTFWLCSGLHLDVFAIPPVDPQTLMPVDGSPAETRNILLLINSLTRLAAILVISSPFAYGITRLTSVGQGRWIAVVLTGALFSAAHLSPSAALPLFAFGAFMCLVRDRYGLLTCMAIHCCFNLWNLVWLKLAPNASSL
ncbi:MAG: CPBP family intramembrane metalloprotease [Opitutales bacterium]|nr:CPBP family intramembrane metalloprotease [Opitutales bacterium]